MRVKSGVDYHALAVARDAIEEDNAPELVKPGGEVAIGRTFLEEEVKVCHVVVLLSDVVVYAVGGTMGLNTARMLKS